MKRLATASAAAVLLTVVLAGCDQNMVLGPAAIQRRGSDLIVAVCRSIDAASVTLDTWRVGLAPRLRSFLRPRETCIYRLDPNSPPVTLQTD